MLPDIGGTELLVIAAVALIVVGPKDLPVLLRKLGQFVGKMRGMAAEFRSSFDEMARQSELEDLRREVEAMRSGQYSNPIRDAAEQAKDVGVDQVFADIDASLNSGSVQFSPAEAYPPNPALVPEPAVEIVAPKPRKPRAAKVVAEAAPASAKAPRKRAAPKAGAVIEAPKAVRAPRKKAAKAGASTSSDIVS